MLFFGGGFSTQFSLKFFPGNALHLRLGTLRYEDGKARTGTAVDAGNFHGSRCVVKNKMLKMRIFSKDGVVNNSNFVKAIPYTETVTSFRL